MARDPYAALGLTKNATAEDIKKAYRKIARTDHPDLNPNDPTAEQRFKNASAAYDFLKDSTQRKRFDAGEIDATGAEQAPRGYYRDEARQPQNPYARSNQQQQANMGDDPFGQGFDADDFFANFARGYQRDNSDPRSGADIPGRDVQYRLAVSFLDAARGNKTRITLPDGASIEVKIPEGARDGQTLRLRGKGEKGYGAGPAGDALITLDVQTDPDFERVDDDVLTTLSISIDEAILGAKVPVDTITRAVNVTVPAGASSGQVLRLKGKGFKGRTGVGDQLVTLRIVSPPKVDAELKTFMQDWRSKHPYDPRRRKEKS